MTQEEALTLAWRFIEFLETGSVPDGLFAPDVFCDFTMPKWRLQAPGNRRAGYGGLGVLRGRWDAGHRATHAARVKLIRP